MDYTISYTVADMTYTIGDFTRSSRRLKELMTPSTKYGFFQMPDCGYEEVLEVTGTAIDE